MTGIPLLAIRHLVHHRVRSVLLVLCLAVPLFLPVATSVVLAEFRADLEQRAASTPLLAGRAGNRVDLTLAALYFRSYDLESLPFGEVARVHERGDAIAIPLHIRYTARGAPIVATSPEYYRHRALGLAAGSRPALLGECALGARVAARLGLAVGATLKSDRVTVYDLVKPPALAMSVCGVFAPTGTADDDAVFVDSKTGWVLDGHAHGHEDVEQLDQELILGREGSAVAVSPAMVEHQVVTARNLSSFHFHGELDELPITALMVVPATRKAGTILATSYNHRPDRQMLVPRAVIEELMAVVFRFKVVVDVLTAMLAVCTAVLAGLVLFLSARLRAREMTTLHRIGCGRRTVLALMATEIAVILCASAVLAGVGVLAIRSVVPYFLRVW